MKYLTPKLSFIVAICHIIPQINSSNEQSDICLRSQPNIDSDKKNMNKYPSTVKEAMYIVEQHYPEKDIHEIETVNGGLPIRHVFTLFNRHIQSNTVIIDFREYYALTNFKVKGYLHLYEDCENFRPHQAFEMVNALISVGERFCHNFFGHEDAHKAVIIDKGTNRDAEILSLWRGEVRKRKAMDDFIRDSEYFNGHRFMSFSKNKKTAMKFMRHWKPIDDEVLVLYELKPFERFFDLDLTLANFNVDLEDEVIIYPNMKFRIVNHSERNDPETSSIYVHIEMLNDMEMSFDGFRENNGRILKKYREQVQRSLINGTKLRVNNVENDGKGFGQCQPCPTLRSKL